MTESPDSPIALRAALRSWPGSLVEVRLSRHLLDARVPTMPRLCTGETIQKKRITATNWR